MKVLKLTNEELGTLCTSLAHLYHAGIGGADALTLLAQDEQNRDTRALLHRMAARADEGVGLGRVFAAEACFPGYLCGLLNVGEQVGRTEQTLQTLGEHYRSRARMDERLRAALLYPAVLLAVMLAVVVVLLVWVLPVFNDVYAQLGSRLAGVAGGLLRLGQALRAALPALCVLVGVMAVGLILFSLWPAFGQRFAALWRAWRGDRGVNGRIAVARFLQALAMGMGSGMTQQQALELALTLADNGSLVRRGRQCLGRVEQGDGLAQALRESGLLAAAQSRVLDAGIRSGQGERVMEQLAERQLERGEAELENAVARVEPVLVVVTCVMVGIILLSVMLPLIHIMTGIG
ncbi:MAG: type II secretion system F family protein [Oscillospiraceae bacterium]|nr:type II secretion system F family protein [Oscillospiraceae bacterium]